MGAPKSDPKEGGARSRVSNGTLVSQTLLAQLFKFPELINRFYLKILTSGEDLDWVFLGSMKTRRK